MNRNDELVAVVPGGSRGIDKRVARALAESGATVYIAGRSQAGGIHTSAVPRTFPGRQPRSIHQVGVLFEPGLRIES